MLSIGNNRKLKRGKIAVFNLPARKDICGRECHKCYAKKAQRQYPKVMPFRINNYNNSMLAGFESDMVKEISDKKRHMAAVRVHESGDFYGQEYIDKWYKIAEQLKDTTFYAYTKRKAELNFSKLEALPNFIVIDSCKHGPINYGDAAFVTGLAAKGAYVCPASKDISCNSGCNYCLTKDAQATGVVFHAH